MVTWPWTKIGMLPYKRSIMAVCQLYGNFQIRLKACLHALQTVRTSELVKFYDLQPYRFEQ